MKKYKFLFLVLVALGSFLAFTPNSQAFTCNLSFSSPHGSQIYVGDRVTWALSADFSGGKSYWFGTKNGITDVSAIDTGLSNPFTWTTDPYPSDTIGNYTRWVQVNDVNGNFVCQTPLVYVSVVNPPAPPPTASLSVTPSTVTAGQSITYNWASANAVSWAWTLNIFKTSDVSHTVSTDGCGNSNGNWSGPSGGNSVSGSLSIATASCQAGYTYNITYSAYNGPNQSGQATSAYTTVTVYAPAPAPSTGALSFSQNSFNFNYTQGGTVPAVQSLTFTNTSTIPVNYTISVNNQPAWFNSNYATSQLTASAGSTTGLGAGVNPAGLNPGTYSSGIILAGNFAGSPLTVPVTLTVTAPITTPTITALDIRGPLCNNITCQAYTATDYDFSFYAEASVPGTTLSTLIGTVDWGNGAEDFNIASGYPKHIQHRWNNPGTYIIKFTAQAGVSGPSKSGTLTHSVLNSISSTPTPVSTCYWWQTNCQQTPTPSPTPTPTCYWWQSGCTTSTPAPTSTPALTPTPSSSSTPIPTNQTVNPSRIYSLSEINDGDIVRSQGDIAVWIVKIVGEKRYKRWLFGPQIFTAYGHLGFNKVKNISKVTLNNFDTSNLIRKFDDAKVYELTDFVPGVRALRRWIPTAEIFLQRGFDFDSIYTVNQAEFNLYTEGSPLPVTLKNNLPLTANLSDAMARFFGLTK